MLFLLTFAAGAFMFFGADAASAASGDGQQLFLKCTNNDCSKVENETALYLQSGNWKLLDGFAGIGWDGTARIRTAADGAQDRVASVADVQMGLAWTWFSPQVRFNGGLASTWNDAFGLKGLALNQTKVGGYLGIFDGSFDLAVDANASLPPIITSDLGIVVNAPVTFSTHLNQNPVLAFQIGSNDGGTVSLRPLATTGLPTNDKLIAIDEASFVIAPKGGSLNGKTYDPGAWLSFQGAIGGKPMDLTGSYDVNTRHLVGNGNLTQLTLGALTLKDWKLNFDVAPAGGTAAVSGGVDVASGPSLTVAGNLRTGSGCGICATLKGTASNVVFDSVTLNSMNLDVSANFDTTSMLNATLAANTTLMGKTVAINGNIAATNGAFTTFSASGSTSAICLKTGACLTGANGTGGPSFTAVYDSSAPKKLNVNFQGGLQSSNIKAAINGTLNATGADFTGTLAVTNLANAAISGHFYQGAGLAGVKVARRDGTLVQALEGDWRADATAAVDITLSGNQFKGGVKFSAGSVGTDNWVTGGGTASVNNPTTGTNFNASITGSFSSITSGGPVDYTLNVAGSGTFRGFTSTAQLIVTPSSVAINATAFVPDIGTNVAFNGSGKMTCTNGVCTMGYAISGSADFRLNGIRAHGAFDLSDATPIHAVIDAAGSKTNMGFSAHFDATVPDGGSMCANASANAYISSAPYVGTIYFNGTISYCNRQISGKLTGGLNFTLLTGEVFDVAGYFHAGVDAAGQLTIDVNNTGFTVTGGGTGNVFTEEKFLFTSSWCCRINYAPTTLTVANNQITMKVKVLFWDVTLYSQSVPYLTQTFQNWD